MLRFVMGTVVVLLTMGVGAGAFILWGAYDVSALQQHTPPVYLALDAAMKRSISRRAEEIVAPPLDDPEMIQQGLRRYQTHCVQCHGAPGVARHDLGKGLTPVPASLVETARAWTPAEIFWTVKHGVKMTGMPAWRFEYTDGQIWSIVAFVMQMPRLSPIEYKEMAARTGTAAESADAREQPTAEPNPERGRLALQSYACTACHTVPGVVGPEANVGPPLGGIGDRRYIAGVLPNTFDNMVRWIRDPVEVDPRTAMPDLDVREQDAVDIAAYLYQMDNGGLGWTVERRGERR